MINDLREFIERVEEVGESKVIDGVDWDLEIGAITEWAASVPGSPLLLFDNIKGYPGGYRVSDTSLRLSPFEVIYLRLIQLPDISYTWSRR